MHMSKGILKDLYLSEVRRLGQLTQYLEVEQLVVKRPYLIREIENAYRFISQLQAELDRISTESVQLP